MDQSFWMFVVGQAIVFIGVGISIYTKMMVKLKELELRVKMVEKQDDNIISKLDSLQESINDVKLTLENKKDRDK